MISAHWESPHPALTAAENPALLFDYSGFPAQSYQLSYPATGAPQLAAQIAEKLQQAGFAAELNPGRGWDHGVFVPLLLLRPQADIPVVQLSLNATRPMAYHLELARRLDGLRDRDVMILGSGNVVHNLRRLDRGAGETDLATAPWAQGFDGMVKQAMDAQDLPALAAWEFLSDGAATAVPFPDHYFPMLYAAGAAQAGESPRHVFEGFHEGTLSMRCVQWG
mgnify:CR=1 FL=1